MILNHIKAPLNKFTFKSTKIRAWVESYCIGKVLNLFAGETKLSIDEIRNDIRNEMPADFHLDAIDFVSTWNGGVFDTIILDPPYSFRKSMELYEGAKMSGFNRLKNILPSILAKNGRIITLGYHSISMGAGRGFTPIACCLISHGGAIHDTIITVEQINNGN